MELFEKTIASKKLYEGKILNLRIDDVILPDGKKSNREIVEHPGGVSILAVKDNGKILIVKQFRKAANKALFEIPAGKLEFGENPDACAKRELMEETGYTSEKLKLLLSFYPSPGFSEENIYVYLAENLREEHVDTDDDEFLEVYEYTINELVEMIKKNEIVDAKTIIAILYYINLLKFSNK